MALLVVLALAASACGGTDVIDGGDGTEPATGEADTPAEQEPAAPSGIETSTTENTQASGASCYEGETATFVVSFGAGGGYDLIARTIAPYLEDELGATVIVENQTGAGGLLALNSLSIANPDGLRFGFFTGQGIMGSVLGGAEGVNFDVMDLSFVGRVAADPRVLVVGGGSELQTIEDVQAAQGLQFGSSGSGANDYIDATVLFDILDIDSEIVTGFDSAAEIELALTSGDIDMMSGTAGSRRSAIRSGDQVPVLSIGSEPIDEYPDVPALTDLDLDQKALAIAEAHSDLQEMGRMIWAPPGVPEGCLEELVAAMETVLTSPELVAELEAQDQQVDWVPGPEMRETAEGLMNAPESFSQLLQSAYSA